MKILAKDEDNCNSLDKDDTRVDIEQSTQKFVDVARQVESFFLQKRFVLSALKPELILKEVRFNFYRSPINHSFGAVYINPFFLRN